MISKELLSEVLEVDLTERLVVTNGNKIQISFPDRVEDINIHELAHKCKEWAFKKGYMVGSGRRLPANQSFIDIDEWYSDCVNNHDFVFENAEPIIFVNRSSEPEAIFKACQWIYDKETK